MSLSATLTTALTGLATAQRALSVTAHNVANANTEGYTRKVAAQETLLVDGRGAGARPLDAQRVVDEFIDGELREQQSRLGRSATLGRYHDRLQETLFGAPGDANRGLPNHIGRLASAAEALANAPEKGALRVAFIGAAHDLTRQIADDASRVQALRADVDREIGLTVASINADIDALHGLNVEIVRGRAPAELLDRRDALLKGLAEKLPISIARHENGAIAVYTRGGQALLEYGPNRLDYRPAAQMTAGTVFGPIRVYRAGDVDSTGTPAAEAVGAVLVSSGVRASLTPELRADGFADADQVVTSPLDGGRLQGLLEARDRLLPEIGDQLGELGRMVRFTLNAAHNGGVPHPPPATLVGTRTDLSGWDGAANGGTAHVAVIDRRTGATLATVAVDPSAPSPAALAAQISSGLGALGAASFGSAGELRITLADPAHGLALDEGNSRIVARDPSGRTWNSGFAHHFGLNDLIVSTGSDPTALTVRPDILADSSKLSAVALTVEVGPPPVALAGGGGDSRPAQALAKALQMGVDTVARGAIAARRVAVGEYAAEIVALSAVAAGQAKNAEAADRALVEDLAFRQGSISGVNVDEELSRLVLYQQAYSVSARILSIANELFDDVLAIAR